MEFSSASLILPFDGKSTRTLRNENILGPEGPVTPNFEQNDFLDSCLRYEDDLETFLLSPKPVHAENEAKSKTLQCEICRKHFDNEKRYYGHLRVHSKENIWRCDKCLDKNFATRRQLMQHVKCSHSSDSRRYQCTFCPMAYEISSRLKQHLTAMHFDFRPHTCKLCSKKFSKKCDLQKHMAIHNGDKCFVCQHCQRRFSDGSNLKRHMVTHAQEKGFVCWACGKKFTQCASLKRHTTRCRAQDRIPLEYQISYSKKYYCKVCGIPFQYENDLTTHMARDHKTPKGNETGNERVDDKLAESDKHIEDHINNCYEEQKDSTEPQKPVTKKQLPKLCEVSFQNKNNITDYSSSVQKSLEQNDKERYLERGKSVDAFVNELLFGNDNNIVNNLAMSRNDTLNIHETDRLLNEMNQLYSIDDELLYNDIDIDSLNPSQFFNTDTDVNLAANSEMLFDYTEGSRSVDQDLMNALYHVKAEHLPDELLNVKRDKQINTQLIPSTQEETSNCLESTLSVDDCSTIFEKDVDLEASKNLAANLNQLIGDNDVQYISTENDDTFIISLKNNIDAEQLTDMLNIDLKLTNKNEEAKEEPVNSDRLSVEPNCVADVQGQHKIGKMFVCQTCKKEFKKRDNYLSHIAIHDPSLRKHRCSVCRIKFSYRSTMNKHMRSAHEPRVTRAHACPMCDKPYKAAWMLKNHIKRNHYCETPFVCKYEDCGKKFFKRCDLEAHLRCHTGERPYRCATCGRAFLQSTHLLRHRRNVHTKQRKSSDLVMKGKKSLHDANANEDINCKLKLYDNP